MIEDPIRLWNSDRFKEICNQNIKKAIFAISANGKTLSLMFVIGASDDFVFSPTETLWSTTIAYGYQSFYMISKRNNPSREEFIDHLRESYPEHFEWLLFHPEWLLC